jgi:hypothetical protein
MAVAIARPKLEGNIAVGDRQIGFAEFGDPQGRAIFGYMARRAPVVILMEARVYAEQRQSG